MCNPSPVEIGTEYNAEHSRMRNVVYIYGERIFEDTWEVGISQWSENELKYEWTRKWEQLQVARFKEWLAHG